MTLPDEFKDQPNPFECACGDTEKPGIHGPELCLITDGPWTAERMDALIAQAMEGGRFR